MVHLSGGGGLGCLITHCTECEHVGLAGGISLLDIDGEPGGVLGKARGGVTGGVLDGRHEGFPGVGVHDGRVSGRAFVVDDEGQECNFKSGTCRIFLLKSFSSLGTDMSLCSELTVVLEVGSDSVGLSLFFESFLFSFLTLVSSILTFLTFSVRFSHLWSNFLSSFSFSLVIFCSSSKSFFNFLAS